MLYCIMFKTQYYAESDSTYHLVSFLHSKLGLMVLIYSLGKVETMSGGKIWVWKYSLNPSSILGKSCLR
jgi:hypothetical protein